VRAEATRSTAVAWFEPLMNRPFVKHALDGPSELALRLHQLPWQQGLRWALEGGHAFRQQPLALMSLLTMMLLIAMLLGAVPILGGLVSFAMVPMLSLVYMVAVAQRERGVVSGEPTHPMLALSTLARRGGARWKTLATLCAAYTLAALAVMTLAMSVSDGAFDRLAALQGSPLSKAMETELMRVAMSAGFRQWMTTLLVGFAALSLLFWHAAALIWWGNQGVRRALVFSLVALWRNAGAYLTYGVVMSVVGIVIVTLVALLTRVFLITTLAGTFVTVVTVALLVWFYASQWASFCDTFGVREALGEPLARADGDARDATNG
jgi:hypothetical protein